MKISKWLGLKPSDDKSEGSVAEQASASHELEATTNDARQDPGAGSTARESESPWSAEDITERLAEAKSWHRSGDIAAAETVYRQVLAENPHHADARHMMGVVAMQRGQLGQAEIEFRAAIEQVQDQADYHNNLGSCLSQQGRHSEARGAFLRTVELAPSHVPARVNYCTALLDDGDNQGAADVAIEILERVPNEPRAALNLGAALTRLGSLQEAITGLRTAVAAHPDNVNLLVTLASAQEMFNDLDDALETIQVAERLKPDDSRVVMIAGLVFRRLEFPEQAVEYLERAIDLGLSTDFEAEAQHQLGLALDTLNRSTDAFNAFATANQLAGQGIDGVQVAPERFMAEVGSLRAYFTVDKLSELAAAAGPDDRQPVFFVGFPRSGTTLMEQVLRAHRQIVTTEEISPLVEVLHEIRHSAGGYPAGLDRLNAGDWARLRDSFWEFSRTRLGYEEGSVLVDKLPLNLVHLGLASVLFPKARVIMALRDPRDVVLSCFMQKFELNDAMANFLTLQGCTAAYSRVMDLARHYQASLPLSMYQYRYEDLVGNFEEVVSGVLQHLGLDWDVTLHGYRETARQNAILTPSYRDVAAPLNNRAIARWQRYPQLGELGAVLDLEIEHWGYVDD